MTKKITRPKIILLYLILSLSMLNSQVVVVPGYTISSIAVTNTVEQISVDYAGKRILLTGPSTTGKLDIFDINTSTTTTISSVFASSMINCWFPYSSTDIEYHNGYMYSCLPHNASSRDSIVKTNLTNGTSSIILTPSMPSGLSGIEGGAAFIGNKLYFTSPNASGNIFCLNLNTMIITTFSVNIPLVSYHTMEYNPVDDRLYVSAGNALYRVNLITPTINLIGNLNSATFSQFALDPNGLYAWTQDGSTISKMSLATGVSTTIVNALGGIIYQDLKFGPSTGTCNVSGTSLYIGNNSNLLELKGFTNSAVALSIPTLTYCLGSTFKLPYLAIGNYCAGNVFAAQLSDAAGSFTSPITIGTKTTTSEADTLLCTIPSTLSAGTGYKIRITASAPTITGVSSAMTLTVIASPVPVISVNSGSICSGNSFTMVPSGAVTYSYSSGSAVVNPSVTSSYSVIGTNSIGCVSSVAAISTLTVYGLPTLTVNSGAICIGKSFTISPSGAISYTVSGGLTMVSPTTTTSYSVNGTDANGCISALALSNVTVNSLPIITATSSNSLICLHKTAVLTGNGAFTYTWLPSGMGTNILVSPTITTNYTVSGTDANGCISMDTLTQFVSTCAGIEVFSSMNSELSFFPNPFRNHFYVGYTGNISSSEVNIVIYNIVGSVIYGSKIENKQTEIDIEKEPNGMYFIKITRGQEIMVKKVIKE